MNTSWDELPSGAGTHTHVRALFLSDVHLGTRSAQAERLLEFLRHCEADTIYLVGDIVDFWRVRRGPHWPQAHNDVLQKLMRRVRKGTRLVFVPGNHDECIRDYIGLQFGGIEIHQDGINGFFVTRQLEQGRRITAGHARDVRIVICHESAL